MTASAYATDRPDSAQAEFAARGFLGPITILSADSARQLKRTLAKSPAPDTWAKGAAVTCADYYEIATHPAILDRVASLLGEDVMLCGANLAEREPGQIHHWHADVHVANPIGRAVTVWLGLENVNQESALHLLPGSHTFGVCPLECAQREEKSATQITEEDVVNWACEVQPNSHILKLDIGDGDALFFDGRMWHGSHNTNSQKWRTALLLHYATPDKPIRMHQAVHQWPFRYIDDPQPPCQMVRGTDCFHVNRMVSAPLLSSSLKCQVFDLAPVIAETVKTHWKPDPFFNGSTRCLSRLMIKTATVHPRSRQHALHLHAEEQLVLGISGEAILELGDPSRPIEVPLKPGTVAYIPPGTSHTLRNDSSEPHAEMTLVWRGSGPCPPLPLGMFAVDAKDFLVDQEELRDRSRAARVIAAGTTQSLSKLQIHVSEMLPGRFGPMHVDAYDVVFVVLEGQVQTLDQIVSPGQVVFYPAGEPHQLSTAGEQTARCLAVEFHSSYTGKPHQSVRRWITSRLPRPIRQMGRRVRGIVRQRFPALARKSY